jgi:hypothetical protein
MDKVHKPVTTQHLLHRFYFLLKIVPTGSKTQPSSYLPDTLPGVKPPEP